MSVTAIAMPEDRQPKASKGFQRKKTYLLQFADGEYEGFEVRLKSLKIGMFTHMTTVLMKLDDAPPDEQIEEVNFLFETLADSIVDWNLRDDDDPDLHVPATLEGIRKHVDFDMAMFLVQHWMTAMGDVSGPLAESSTSGVPSQVVSLPTERLSESP